jgi:hypothetical protein
MIIFRGDLTDISAEKEALPAAPSKLQKRVHHISILSDLYGTYTPKIEGSVWMMYLICHKYWMLIIRSGADMCVIAHHT